MFNSQEDEEFPNSPGTIILLPEPSLALNPSSLEVMLISPPPILIIIPSIPS